MKLNLSNAKTGLQKRIEVDDEKMLFPFYERRIGAEVPGDSLGQGFAGTVFRITGGSDKQGFPMMQGVLTNKRVRLLFRDKMKKGKAFVEKKHAASSYSSKTAALEAVKANQASACGMRKKHFKPLKAGQMTRKSIRGCIVGSHLSVLNLVLVKKGPEDIEGLTDGAVPRRLGPKRATKIRKLFNLSKEDDVRKYIIARTFERPNQKMKRKAPKIQRLITSSRLQRKRREKAVHLKRIENSQKAKQAYFSMLEEYKATKHVGGSGKKTKGISAGRK